MRLISLLTLLLWLLSTFVLLGQNGNQSLRVSISPVSDAHVCCVSSVTMSFSNNTSAPIQLQAIEVDLDNHQDGLITLSGVTNSPGFQIVSGLGSSTPAFSSTQQLPSGSTATLTMQIKYSCSFFDMLNNLNGYFVEATTTWQGLGFPPSAPLSETVQTPNYNIGYSYVTPSLNLPSITASYETPFDIQIPLEISGNYCDKDFTVNLGGRGNCFDFGGLSYSLVRNGTTYGPFSLPPVPSGPNYTFEVNAPLGMPYFCGNNYSGGLGNELTLIIHNVVANCGCGSTGTFYHIPIGFTPCKSNEAPSDCLENGQLKSLESTSQEITFTQPLAGKLTLSNIGGDVFGLQNTNNTLILKVENNTTSPVYQVKLDILGAFGYNITRVTFPNGDFWENQPASESMFLNFSDLNFFGVGLQDLDLDGIYAELGPGQYFTMEIDFERLGQCALGGSNACEQPCNTASINEVIRATAYWNNICGSMSPEGSSQYEHGASISPATMNVKYNGAKLEYNQERRVEVELKFAAVEGFDGYLDQGDMHHYICINSNLGCINYTMNGIPVSSQSSTAYIDLGVIPPNQLGNVTSIAFEFLITCCPPELTTVELNLSYGVFFQNSPDCYLQLGCGNARFLSPCSGSNPGVCTLFKDLAFNVENTQAEGVRPLKVYPCDCLEIEVRGTVESDVANGQLLVGVLISDEFWGYFKSPYMFSGDITVGSISPIFEEGVYQDIPGEPYGVIYFASTSQDLIAAGAEISGSFELCMTPGFPNGAGFDKMDFFAPALGVQDGDNKTFCYTNFEDLYALNVGYTSTETRATTCSDGGTLNIQLVKTGGELHTADFPGVSRVVAKITDNRAVISLNGDNPNYRGRGENCADLGNAFFAPVNMMPTGLEAAGEVLQSVTSHFDENCGGNLPIEYFFMVENRVGETSECHSFQGHSGTPAPTTIALPNIVSNFNPALGNSQYLINNTFTFDVFTTNTGADAANAWIQLEYDPAKIEILNQVIPPVIGSCGKSVYPILIGSLPNGVLDTRTIQVRFLQPSCVTPPSVSLYAFHNCGCVDVPQYNCASTYSSPKACQDSKKDFYFKFMGADLLMGQIECVGSSSICVPNTYKAIFRIDNYEQGNMNYVAFHASLPPGVNIVEAVYSRNMTDCSALPVLAQVDIAALISGSGWFIPDNGNLFGVQSGEPDAKRRGFLEVTFSGNGVDPANDNITLLCRGTKPCGEVLQKTVTIENVSEYWELPTGQLSFTPSNWCGLVATPDFVTVNITLNISANISDYPPVVDYTNAKIVCDANNNGVADPNELVIFNSPSSQSGNIGTLFQLFQSPNGPQTYVGAWTIPVNGSMIGCIGGNAILVFESLYTYWPNSDFPTGFCYSLTSGPVCGGGPAQRLSGTEDQLAYPFQSKVQPNPFSRHLNLLVSGAGSTRAKVVVYNQVGINVYSGTYSTEPYGDTSISLDLADLPSGAYVLYISTENEVKRHMVIKQ